MPVRDCGSMGNALGAVKMSTSARFVNAMNELAVGDEDPLLVGGHSFGVVQTGGEGNGFAVVDPKDGPGAVGVHHAGDGNVHLSAQAHRHRSGVL